MFKLIFALKMLLCIQLFICSSGFASQLGVFPLAEAGFKINVTTAALPGAHSDPKDLSSKQMTSLIIKIADGNDKLADEAELVGFDATMPEHRHGMNVVPVIAKISNGTYRVDGVKLHMPGEWQLVFKLKLNGKENSLEIPYYVN